MVAASEAGAPLFAIFVLTLLSLVVFPWTFYKLTRNSEESESAKPWESEKDTDRKSRFKKIFKKRSNVALLLGWLLWFALLFYINFASGEPDAFDPFDILEIKRTATDQEVKKAFRRLSLIYHPDKNPDSSAVTKYLAISQAYKTLTDAEARKNWELHGHPDGRQAVDLGIALPSWVMNNNNSIILLVGLVMVGIVLPLGLAAWFLLSSSKYAGPNQIMQETFEIFLRSKFAVKESQALARIPDTLVYAMEFILMPVPADHQHALEELRKEVFRHYPELKEKQQFLKRKISIVEVHMLLLAQTARISIPMKLRKDLDFVLAKSNNFLDEMIKIANLPRYSPYGWLAPTVGCIEFQQCLTQATMITNRKNKVALDAPPPLYQLPFINQEIMKKLGRKQIRNMNDLIKNSEEENLSLLQSCDFDEDEARQCIIFILNFPTLYVSTPVFTVEGIDGPESTIYEKDLVTCSFYINLQRKNHRKPGKSVLAYAPHYPIPKEEKWYVILAAQNANEVLHYKSISLMEAEAFGVKLVQEALTTENTQLTSVEAGQLVEFKFLAPKQGKHNLTLMIMSDSWLGCDKSLQVKLITNELSRAQREGRVQSLTAAESASDAEEEFEDDDEYDSGEGSTEESGSDDE